MIWRNWKTWTSLFIGNFQKASWNLERHFGNEIWNIGGKINSHISTTEVSQWGISEEFSFFLFFKCGFCPSKCYKVTTVNNGEEAPSFENLRYDPLENSKNILF